MDQKDITSSNLINSKEQLLDEFGVLFSEEMIAKEPYYLEKPSEDALDIHRFIITPSGIVAVTTSQREEVWEIGTGKDDDEKILLELDQVINQAFVDIENLDVPTLLVQDRIYRELTEAEMERYITEKRTKALVKEINIDSLTLYIRIFPYGGKRSSEVVRYILNERKNK